MLRRMPPLAALAGLLTMLLVPAPAAAAPPPAGEEREMVEKVNRAIDRGVQYLKAQHNTCGGHKLDVTYVDDQTTATAAVNAAKDLIGQGYKIVAGSNYLLWVLLSGIVAWIYTRG